MNLLLLAMQTASGADVPALSVERGLYDAPVTVTLTPAVATDVLRCSTDGTVPAVACVSPLSILSTTTLRVMAIGADGTRSAVTTQTYLFPADIVTQSRMNADIVNDPTYGPILDGSLRSIPSLSVVLPRDLSLTEQAVSIEWIDPAGEDSQVNCGAEVIGGTSQVYEKQSIRLHFRSEYGAGKWDQDIYGDYPVGVAPAQSFDALTLRSGNHDSLSYLGTAGQYTRNYWMDETQLEMGHLAPHGRYVHLYVNGSYNGQYHVRERFDAGFMAEYLGGDEEEYEAINGGAAFDGSGASWNQLIADAASGDYPAVQSRLNVENFLDYMVLQWYAANSWDWAPDHNWIAAGPSAPNQGGFIFHSSDSDICLYYSPDTNILALGGPSYLYSYLITDADPDFMVALADAIHRNLQAGGPLTASRAAERYGRIAASVEPGIIPESARFGYGAWSYAGDWIPERDWLLGTFFDQRTSTLLIQLREAGWYTLDAPVIDTEAGMVSVGAVVGVTVPDGVEAELWVTTDGSDPREPGGAVSPSAQGPDPIAALALTHGARVRARLRSGATWGPLASGDFDVDEAPPIVLNEWNTVAPDDLLEDGDSSLGSVAGDGGDWVELLVLEDHLDLRGWTLQMVDRHQNPQTVTFTASAVLGDLRAGTILTVAEDLPEDAAYAPSRGDWRFHLTASVDGLYAQTTGFDVTEKDWQLEIRDAVGSVRAAAVGEGVNGLVGVSASEVGQLAETPGAGFRTWTGAYAASGGSTFGSPNVWDGGEQDLSGLRGEVGEAHDIEDSGEPDSRAQDSAPRVQPSDTSPTCGCAARGDGGSGWLLLVAAALVRRRAAAGIPPRAGG